MLLIHSKKGLIAMYKDDNLMSREGCSEALLRMMLDGRGNTPSQRQNKPSCEGDYPMERDSWGLVSYPLASVYAPLQEFAELYDLDMALEQGTIFQELDLPFMGQKVGKGGKCCG